MSFLSSTSQALAAVWLASAMARAGTVMDLSGNQVDPFARAHGHTVVLLFVRSDCPISNRYAPTIQQLAQKYAVQANFWLVYPGKSQTTQAIKDQVGQYGYRIPALRDTESTLVAKSGATVTPEAVVFLPRGKLVYRGRIDNRYEDLGRSRPIATSHELDDAVGAAIKGKMPTLTATRAVGCSLADLE